MIRAWFSSGLGMFRFIFSFDDVEMDLLTLVRHLGGLRKSGRYSNRQVQFTKAGRPDETDTHLP